MASNAYIKSFIWLAASGGLAYGLMLLTAPSEQKIQEIQKRGVSTLKEEDIKKLLFLQKIKEAAREDPIYLKNSKKEN